MITLMLLMVMVGALWLVGSVIGLVFKLTFGLIGGLFGLLAGAVGLLIGGVALLLVLPIVALSLLPLALPALLIVAVVWAIARSARRPVVATIQH